MLDNTTVKNGEADNLTQVKNEQDKPESQESPQVEESKVDGNNAQEKTQDDNSNNNLKEDQPDTGNNNYSKSAIDNKSIGSDNTNINQANNSAFVKTVTTKNLDFNFGVKPEKNIIFSFSDTSNVICLKKGKFFNTQQKFYYPENSLKELKACLENNRILLLTGSQNTGKYHTSLYLADLLIKEEKAKEATEVRPMRNGVKVNFYKEVIDSDYIKNKVIIFRDILAHHNTDIIEVFKELSQAETRFDTKKLIDKKSYLIITSCNENIDNNKIVISNLDNINKNIYLPSENELLEFLDNKIKSFCLEKNQDYNDIDAKLKEKNTIVKELNTIPNIHKFVDDKLIDIIDQKKTIFAAINEVNDVNIQLEHWILNDICKDFKTFKDLEVWYFLLTLVLFEGLSWTEFEKINKKITYILLNHLKSDEFEKNKFYFSPSENLLLKACKAQIVKEGYAGTDIIQFCDEQYADKLFKIILKNNRRTLLLLERYFKDILLEEISSKENLYYDFKTLNKIASNIGRIGEIAPEDITFKLVNKWAGKFDWYINIVVGCLYEGVLKSECESYIKESKLLLNKLAYSDDPSRQLAAIAVYGRIGVSDIKFSMKELKKIQENFLKNCFETIDLINNNILLNSGLDSIFDTLYQYVKKEKVKAELEAEVLRATCESILFFCHSIDPIDVLSELRKWIITDENPFSKFSVVVFFFGGGGIAETLNNEENSIIRFLGSSQHSINKMYNFLSEVYSNCFNIFDNRFQKELEVKFFEFLKKCSELALDDEQIKFGMEGLLLELYRSGGNEIQKGLYHCIFEGGWISCNQDNNFINFLDQVKRRIIRES